MMTRGIVKRNIDNRICKALNNTTLPSPFRHVKKRLTLPNTRDVKFLEFLAKQKLSALKTASVSSSVLNSKFLDGQDDVGLGNSKIIN